jgi:Flp pilus assembly protein TadD
MGRALLAEGRPDASERMLRRGLALDPEDARLERALADALDAQGRPDEAGAARTRADALDPPPPPLPTTASLHDGAGVLVLLLKSEDPDRPASPSRWPETSVAEALARRVAIRLPGATFERADPARVPDALAWLEARGAATVLTLRVDRAWCGFTVKDGRLGVAELRATRGVRGQGRAAPAEPASRHFDVVLEDPQAREDCRAEALARAFETVLGSDAWQTAAPEPSAPGATWRAEAMRSLFPGIGRRVLEALRSGRALLAAGALGEAEIAFARAVEIDPTDPLARSYLEDARRSVGLARELAGDAPASADGASATSVDPQLSAGQRAAAEAALGREEHRREELLAALAVLDEDIHSPSVQVLSTLRPIEVLPRDAFGPNLARERAGDGVAARAAYAPDGSVLARYYFPPGSSRPILREEDTDGDGRPDRWITYRGDARSEIFEDGAGRGRPDLWLSFSDGGSPLDRVQFDRDGDGEPDRVFLYRGGTLHAERRDTDGDGVLDRFDRLDADGRVDVREEDIDGDGEIDVRSLYRGGKLVRREISEPQHVPES